MGANLAISPVSNPFSVSTTRKMAYFSSLPVHISNTKKDGNYGIVSFVATDLSNSSLLSPTSLGPQLLRLRRYNTIAHA